MQLEHNFDVPVPVDEAWRVLLDVERIAPCLPGATLDSVDGSEFQGRVKIKAGPITVSYTGMMRMDVADEATHRVVLDAQGREPRGSGTVKATVTAQLHPGDGTTSVQVVTDLAITGKPAQLGRGMIADVAGKIIDQFAANLAEEISASRTAATALSTSGRSTVSNGSVSTAPAPPAGSTGRVRAAVNDDTLDLFALIKPQLTRAGIGIGLIVLAVILLRRLFSSK